MICNDVWVCKKKYFWKIFKFISMYFNTTKYLHNIICIISCDPNLDDINNRIYTTLYMKNWHHLMSLSSTQSSHIEVMRVYIKNRIKLLWEIIYSCFMDYLLNVKQSFQNGNKKDPSNWLEKSPNKMIVFFYSHCK